MALARTLSPVGASSLFSGAGVLRSSCPRLKRKGQGPFYVVDCDIASFIFLAIAEVMNYPLYLVRLPEHNFVRWQIDRDHYINYETMSGEVYDNEHYVGFNISPKYSYADGSMKNLSLQETVGYHDALVGMVWSWYGKYDLMTKRYAESVSKDPSWSAIANSLGWFYATAPGGLSDGELAVKYARIAINAFSNADTLDTLACAYARKGEFESASATAVEAGRSDYQRWGGLSPEHKKAIDARVPCVDPKFNPRGKGDSQPFRPHDAYRSPHQRRNPSAVF